jgi:hypothetical protein
MPPVNKNLQYSLERSPLNSKILEESKKENSNLSFSKSDLHILQ